MTAYAYEHLFKQMGLNKQDSPKQPIKLRNLIKFP